MLEKSGLAELVETAKRACYAASDIFSEPGCNKVVSLKHDLKSEADRKADEAIELALRETGIPILSEESKRARDIVEDTRIWIVDPLDGTVNFESNIPMYCVSIGFWENRQPVFGVVYDCVSGEMYSGGRNFPTNCVDTHCVPSIISKPEEAILATGFPSGGDFDSESLSAFVKRIQRFRKIRLLGSAALSLAWVARGRLDGYREEGIYLWDIAAGVSLVLGAGGSVVMEDLDWKTMTLTVSAAGSKNLLRAISGKK